MTVLTTDPVVPLLDSFNAFSLVPYPEDYWTRAESRECFERNESNMQVDWIESNLEDGGGATRKSLRSLAELQAYRSHVSIQKNGLSVISISQGNSYSPLNITQEMFKEIGSITGASSHLLNLALSFYDKYDNNEDAVCSAPTFSCNGSIIEISYIFKYAFLKVYSEGKTRSWVLRQTGVYQKYDMETKNSTWVFMNPNKQCLFQKRLMQMLLSEHFSELKAHPLLIHHILYATFFPSWRDALADWEAEVLPVANAISAQRLPEALQINHQMLKSMRSIETKCSPLRVIFRSFEKTLDALRQANNALQERGNAEPLVWNKMKQLLDSYANQVDVYSQAASVLQSRAATTAQLITDTFSFHNTYTAQEQTEYMLDDSSTVRVITIVTLLYLPSTFMATLLGMNSFFGMDSNTRKLVVSPQFWIFVVCAVPLTAVTVLYWWLWRQRHPRKTFRDA